MNYSIGNNGVIVVDSEIITCDVLLSLAETFMEQYKNSGESSDELRDGRMVRVVRVPYSSNLYHYAEQCKKIASQMKEKCMDGVRAIAHFVARGVELPQEGDMITIPGGVMVYSTKKTLRKENLKSRKVKLHSVSNGYVNDFHGGDPIFDITLRWVGSGGYWCWVKLPDLLNAAK